MTLAEIFVRLLDENVDVWRPVKAEQIASDRFRIVEQPYDRGIERWEFEPGHEVTCEFVEFGWVHEPSLPSLGGIVGR